MSKTTVVFEWIRRLFAVFGNALCVLGGANLRILRDAEADYGDFSARGAMLFVPTIMALAGFTAFIDIITKSLMMAIGVGSLMSVMVFIIDWGILRSLAGAGWRQKLKLAPWRLLFTAGSAYLVTSSLLLVFFASAIGPKVIANQTAKFQRYYATVVEPQYKADQINNQAILDADQKLIDRSNARVVADKKAVGDATFAVTCEFTGTSNVPGLKCPPGTGRAGNGPATRDRQVQLDNANAKLTEDQQALAQLVARLKPDMDRAQARRLAANNGETADKAAALKRYLASNGVLERMAALQDLEDQNLTMRIEALVAEGTLMILDALAVLAALFGDTPAYDAALAALRLKAKLQAESKQNEEKARAVGPAMAAMTAADSVEALNNELAIAQEGRRADFAAKEAETREAEKVRDDDAKAARQQAEAELAANIAQANQDRADAEAQLAEIRVATTRQRAEAVEIEANGNAAAAKIQDDQRVYTARADAEIRALRAGGHQPPPSPQPQPVQPVPLHPVPSTGTGGRSAGHHI